MLKKPKLSDHYSVVFQTLYPLLCLHHSQGASCPVLLVIFWMARVVARGFWHGMQQRYRASEKFIVKFGDQNLVAPRNLGRNQNWAMLMCKYGALVPTCEENSEGQERVGDENMELSWCTITLFPKRLVMQRKQQACTSPPTHELLDLQLCAHGTKLLVMFTCLTGQLRADNLWIWKERKKRKTEWHATTSLQFLYSEM